MSKPSKLKCTLLHYQCLRTAKKAGSKWILQASGNPTSAQDRSPAVNLSTFYQSNKWNTPSTRFAECWDTSTQDADKLRTEFQAVKYSLQQRNKTNQQTITGTCLFLQVEWSITAHIELVKLGTVRWDQYKKKSIDHHQMHDPAQRGYVEGAASFPKAGCHSESCVSATGFT